MYSHGAIYHGKLVALKAISYTGRPDFLLNIFFIKATLVAVRTRVNHEDKQHGKPFFNFNN